ncbi:MAG: O-antigen ligase family protein [Chloroflexi bacterium]|nr:O-antigen ligase family protein [Chloroflexota bacterium]
MASLVAAVQRTAAWIDRWHWVGLILSAPFLLFPSPSRSLALLIIPALWFIGLTVGTAPVRRTPFNLVLLLMFLMILISEWATYELASSLPKIAGMVLGIGLFFALVRIGESFRAWWIACGMLLLSGIGIVGIGLVGTNFGNKLDLLSPIVSQLAPRLRGIPGVESGISPNEVAGTLVWLLPLFLTLTVSSIRLRWSIGAIVGLMCGTLLIFAVLVLTQSRGGYLGIAFTFLGLLLFVTPRRKRGVALILVLILMGIGLAVAMTQPSLLTALVANSNASNPTDPIAVIESANGRVEVWSRAIYGIQDFPFTGMGMNTFRKVITVLYPLFLVSPDYDIAHAHNEFLQAALDLGIPGMIAFTALYLVAFWVLAEIWRAASQSPNGMLLRALSLGFGGGLVAHMVYGMTDAVALGAKPGFIFWMMLGLIAALYNQVRTGRITEWQLGARHD